jgi:hypothetical protein
LLVSRFLAQKELEQRSRIGVHKNEFWWGTGEKRTARSIIGLISQHDAKVFLFSAIKNQKLSNSDPASNLPVWRKYRTLGGGISLDIPKHVLITSGALTKSGTRRMTHFALTGYQNCQPDPAEYPTATSATTRLKPDETFDVIHWVRIWI